MDLSLLSKYRSELMGLATIWVMLYHFRTSFGIAPFDLVSSVGYGGVDIFLFLSGFGLYCSYNKNKDTLSFYYRRFIRIYPIYLFIIIVDSFLKQDYHVINILLKSIGICYFIPFIPTAWHDWYIPSIYLFYLLFPLIYKGLNDSMLKMGGGNDWHRIFFDRIVDIYANWICYINHKQNTNIHTWLYSREIIHYEKTNAKSHFFVHSLIFNFSIRNIFSWTT